jgi:hypothetical protein
VRVKITKHAVKRFRQRVAPLTSGQVKRVLRRALRTSPGAVVTKYRSNREPKCVAHRAKFDGVNYAVIVDYGPKAGRTPVVKTVLLDYMIGDKSEQCISMQEVYAKERGWK